MEGQKLLEYLPFSSTINPSFWQKFTDIKLDIDKLEVTSRSIWGSFSNNIFTNSCNVALLEVDSTSFNQDCQSSYIAAYGVLLNKNTVEEFKECDKNNLIVEKGIEFWKVITRDFIFENPILLNHFFILSFADLKKYHYYYWFCFPTPKLKVYVVNSTPLQNVLDKNMISELYDKYRHLKFNQKPFFLIKNNTDEVEIPTLQHLKEIKNVQDYYFAFSDPSPVKDTPGWPLRNYMVFLMHHCPFLLGQLIKVIAIRVGRSGSVVHLNESIVFTLKLPADLNFENKWIGWEKNETGKFCPRSANMKQFLDPKCLAETSVDLNLKLMKWQLLPEIDLEKIKHTKCLLLGSGTLGCSVARTLLGWGVRTVTFVDNACISYSNPVRQSLFNYEDCIKNKPKATTAAENLIKIFPGVKSVGYNFSIPMPGHPVGETLLAKVKEDVLLLEKLISEHDIIFLLMDSRESRWLPTLLGAHFEKIVMNAALGFDTYLILRHGIRKSTEFENEVPAHSKYVSAISGSRLGCYFCNDVTAPGNSLRHRTLDQQCTVTRPGISAIAGALAVELAISIIQHPSGSMAPAFYKSGNCSSSIEVQQEDECMLGILPHSIRGFLSSYSHVLPATEKYDRCVACSEKVLEEYKQRGFEFLCNVFDSCNYLEEITGLTEMQNEIADLEVWDFDDCSSSSQ